MKKLLFIAVCSMFVLVSCLESRATKNESSITMNTKADSLEETIPVIDSNEIILEKRFPLPKGYERINKNVAFAEYLRSLKLHPIEHDVHYFDGTTKSREGIYCSVVDLPIGKRDRHQCADAVMNVRAHYFYIAQEYDKIHFNFTNGFRADYSKWREGHRIKVSGNDVSYYQTNNESESYESFLSYLQKVYCYAGTYSLNKELVKKDLNTIEPGNVFIKGGFPGHAVIVLDVIENKEGDRKFMLAQSYMPAQELQILINPASDEISPWYSLNEIKDKVYTPEWTFSRDQLKQFVED